MVTATSEAPQEKQPEIKYWLNYGDRVIYVYTFYSDSGKRDVTWHVQAMVCDRIPQAERENLERRVSLNLYLPIGGDKLVMVYRGKVGNIGRIVSRN